MPRRKLTPEGQVIAAYGAAMVAAFQVLISCLERAVTRTVSRSARGLTSAACEPKGGWRRTI
jgi:hypothetical protein